MIEGKTNGLTSTSVGVDQCERNIVDSLLALGIIGIGYTGSVTIHLNQGGVSDYEKNEKGLRKRINLKG